MKKTILLAVMAMIFSCNLSFAQQEQSAKAKIANVEVKDLNGKSVKTSEFSNDGKPYVVCFWATWCKPCMMELTNIAEKYDAWQKESGMKIYAVSIDDARTSGKVKSLVNGEEWTYNVILDANSAFKRAMGVVNPAHTFIISAEGEILYQHAGYTPGDENEVYAKYKELSK